MPPRSVYIHVPFCRHRCGYCDFTLVAGRDDLIESYLDALQSELRSIEEPIEVDTLFLGGGTPSHLPPAQLERLFAILNQKFVQAVDCEFSLEANPADITPKRIAVLADAGVNRISLGVQSFDEGHLNTLERDHTETIVANAVETIRGRIANISLDLIFGVPEQSLDDWRLNLSKAVALQPTHLSTYGLTFEKGTAFWSRLQAGELSQSPDDLERAMYATAMDVLAAAGYEHYEISNFAKPGFRCRHNMTYWTGKPYFAFGPGAASFFDGKRSTNHRSVLTWLKRMQNAESAFAEVEQLSPEDAARERLVIGLRLIEGVDHSNFRRRTGFTIDQIAGEQITRLISNGWLERTATHLRLTREGRFFADSVAVELV